MEEEEPELGEGEEGEHEQEAKGEQVAGGAGQGLGQLEKRINSHKFYKNPLFIGFIVRSWHLDHGPVEGDVLEQFHPGEEETEGKAGFAELGPERF